MEADFEAVNRKLEGKLMLSGSSVLSPQMISMGGERRGWTGPSGGLHDTSANFNGVFGLLCVSLGVFCLDRLLGIEGMRGLYLYQRDPWLHQLVTSLFCHASYAHLSSNLFFIFVFGRIVEEKRGPWGLVGIFLTCGVCANIVTLLNVWEVHEGLVVYYLGASGGVFGLFVVSVLDRLSLRPRSLIEVLVLGQFVLNRIVEELQSLSSGSDVVNINRTAHLSGALAGVLVCLAFLRWQFVRRQNEERGKLV